MFEYLGKMIIMASSLTSGKRPFLVVGLAAILTTSATAETSLTTLRHEVRQLLQQEARLDHESTQEKDAAISALCDLYVVLRSDPRYPDSDMLRGDAAKVRRRLISIANRRENRLRREGVVRPAMLSGAVDQAVKESLASHRQSPEQVREQETEPNLPSGFAGPPFGDNPWQLVELIQRVIAPDLWDVQGGTATIQYFAMRRVLVVRATTDVHEQIRELLMALR